VLNPVAAGHFLAAVLSQDKVKRLLSSDRGVGGRLGSETQPR